MEAAGIEWKQRMKLPLAMSSSVAMFGFVARYEQLLFLRLVPSLVTNSFRRSS